MNIVELEVITPLFSTYHWLGSPGVVAKQNKSSDIWYFNNAIQWTCGRRFLQGFTSPELGVCTGSIGAIPFLEKSGISTRFARNCSLEIIKCMLDDKYYVEFSGVDDYFIPEKSWYQERHFNHDGLISGYDDGDDTFTIVAYDKGWIYSKFKIPQESFIKGLKHMCKEGIYGELLAVKAKDDEQIIDLGVIKDRIKEYLNSSFEIYKPDDYQSAFGVVVYDYLCMYLDLLKCGKIPYERIDHRIFRLVWEHKNCMFLRLKAIEDAEQWTSIFSDSYEEIVTMTNKMRFLYSKYCMRKSDSILETLKQNLMNIKSKEIDILSNLVVILDNTGDVNE